MSLMKNTGVAWIGEIPSEWKLGKVKYGFDRKKEKSTEKNPVVLSLARAGVRVRDISTNEGQLAASYEGYNPVEPNDLLLNPMDLISGANCSISHVSGVISPAYMNLRARYGFEPRYYDYFFKTQYWSLALFAHGKGVSFDNRWTLNESTLRDYFIPMPSYQEQQVIADYLDNLCSKIDEIIAEATASIEEYKELKQAVVTEAVTKGLHNNPTVYSGDPNIGDVSEGWHVCKTLYGLSMPITDGPHTTPELYDDGVPFISAEAISCGQGSIDFDHMRGYISEEFYKECCKKYIPAIDDIYMIKSGATTGRVSMVDTDRKFTIWSPLAVFRVNRDRLIPRYLFYFLQSKPYQQQVQLGWTFGTQQNIGMRTLEKLKICLPPVDEQSEIVEYLDVRVGEMDALISEKQALIDDLQAYKKSLIYEVVTGKRRVV